MGCRGSSAAKPADEQAPEEKTREQTEADTAAAEKIALTHLKLIFDCIDRNQDEVIDQKELGEAFKTDSVLEAFIKQALSSAEHLFQQLDTNGDGIITWDEFYWSLKKAAVEQVLGAGHIAAVDCASDRKAEQELRFLFDGLDRNGDKQLDQDELAQGLARYPGLCELLKDAGFNIASELLEQLDTNKDGAVQWQEFDTHLRGTARKQVSAKGEVSAAAELEQGQHQQVDAGAVEVAADVATTGWKCCG